MFRRKSATSLQETEMADKNLHELEAAGNTGDPVQRLRLLCLSRGANGILRLGRVFRQMDIDGKKKKLHLDEFLQGLKQIGLEVTEDEAQRMFEKFDTDENGAVDMDEFLMVIRPPLSEGRKSIIEKAFVKMDKSGDGEITIDDLKSVYNVKAHPRYIAGENSEERIMRRFFVNFVEDGRDDGIITKEEFFDYYSAVSTSIDNDCYFDLMMRQAYKL